MLKLVFSKVGILKLYDLYRNVPREVLPVALVERRFCDWIQAAECVPDWRHRKQVLLDHWTVWWFKGDILPVAKHIWFVVICLAACLGPFTCLLFVDVYLATAKENSERYQDLENGTYPQLQVSTRIHGSNITRKNWSLNHICKVTCLHKADFWPTWQ